MTPDPICPSLESLSAFVDGEPGDAERAALEAHVMRCPACRGVLADLQQLRSLFAALPEPTLEFDLAPAIDRLTRAPAPGRLEPLPWRWAFGAPGGVAAVGLGLWLGASLAPALGSAQGAGPTAAQMAAFSAAPPGLLCLAPDSCGRASR